MIEVAKSRIKDIVLEYKHNPNLMKSFQVNMSKGQYARVISWAIGKGLLTFTKEELRKEIEQMKYEHLLVSDLWIILHDRVAKGMTKEVALTLAKKKRVIAVGDSFVDRVSRRSRHMREFDERLKEISPVYPEMHVNTMDFLNWFAYTQVRVYKNHKWYRVYVIEKAVMNQEYVGDLLDRLNHQVNSIKRLWRLPKEPMPYYELDDLQISQREYMEQVAEAFKKIKI